MQQVCSNVVNGLKGGFINRAFKIRVQGEITQKMYALRNAGLTPSPGDSKSHGPTDPRPSSSPSTPAEVPSFRPRPSPTSLNCTAHDASTPQLKQCACGHLRGGPVPEQCQSYPDLWDQMLREYLMSLSRCLLDDWRYGLHLELHLARPLCQKV